MYEHIFILLHYQIMTLTTGKRYFIAIIPPEPVLTEIKEMKEDMALRFGSSKALQSPAHITLIVPFEKDLDEDELAGKLKSFAIQEMPFKLKLNGFSCFPNRRFPVLFVKPEPNESLAHMQHALDESLFTDRIISSKMPFAFTPHITIGYRDLTPANFKQAWAEFEYKEYSREVLIKSLFLLKWNFYFARWDIIQEHKFGAEQLSLINTDI